MPSIVDFISKEDYGRYNELLDMAQAAKDAAPKAPRAPRAPLSPETRKKMAEGRLAKAEAALAALMAGEDVGQ